MTERIDKQSSRETIILRELQQAGSVTAEGLCEMLEVSMATVRRHSQDLEMRALLRRTHRGAVAIEPLFL
jgi:DeoR family transcriptional regulator, aga operon transcriptional repressor